MSFIKLPPGGGNKVPGKPGNSTWIVGCIVALAALPFAFTSGIGGVLIALALAALLTGLYIVATGRRSWARIPGGRKVGAVAIGGAAVLFVAGGLTVPRTVSLSQAGTDSPPHATTTAAADSTPAPATTPTPSSPQPSAGPSTATAAPTEARSSAAPIETPKPLTAEIKAVTLLKTSTNWYRDRLDQGHQYLTANDMSSFEAWWTLMNLGKFVDNAQSAYGDASNLYPTTVPTQLDDWDTIMDVHGDFINAVNAWYSSHGESDYSKATAALDHADQTVDTLAPGVTVPRVHGTVAVPAPVKASILAPQAARDAAAAILAKAGQDYSAWFEKGAAMQPSSQQIDWYLGYAAPDQVNAMQNAFSAADKNFNADDEPSSISAWRDAATAIPSDIERWYFSDQGHGEDATLTAKVRADFASIAQLADSVKTGS